MRTHLAFPQKQYKLSQEKCVYPRFLPAKWKKYTDLLHNNEKNTLSHHVTWGEPWSLGKGTLLAHGNFPSGSEIFRESAQFRIFAISWGNAWESFQNCVFMPIAGFPPSGKNLENLENVKSVFQTWKNQGI